jgi:uncharacterized protein YjbJ (UPF0337 family)
VTNDTSVEGQGDQLKGRAEQAYGDLTGDQEHQDKGQAQENRGKVKEAAGNVQDKVDDVKDKLTGSS